MGGKPHWKKWDDKLSVTPSYAFKENFPGPGSRVQGPGSGNQLIETGSINQKNNCYLSLIFFSFLKIDGYTLRNLRLACSAEPEIGVNKWIVRND